MVEALKAEAPKRKKRESHGLARFKLSIPHEIPGWYVRWVNDDGRELDWRLQSDYEFVEPQEVGLASETDSRVRRLVGVRENGDPLYAYLMKIRQDWRDEDVAEESQAQVRFEKQIKGGTIAAEGTEASRYVPKGGISIKHARS